MKGKVLITARSFRKIPGPHIDEWVREGYEILFPPYDRPLEAQELVEYIQDVDAAILGLDKVSREVLLKASRLRVISRYGVGVDNIDLEAATELGVIVTVTPGANSVAVAELTMALILALARKIPAHDRIVRSGKWNRLEGVEIMGGTLGIIGAGRIGQEVGIRARAFGMEILFTDPLPPPEEWIRATQAKSVSLEELLSESDIVTLHAPLNEGTQHLLDANRLSLMKPTAFLINTARGGLVDEKALFEFLRSGRIAGAAIDTFEVEPTDPSQFADLDHFISTPHIGSATYQTALRMGWLATQNALIALRGGRPEHVVNPQVFGRSSDGS
ncbi:MAG: phosphoglycerate dehydrogenase [Anaerolineales bacterium]|nr:phosphoglycerate dehydrogenase [Anaerolineales bacterium]MCS7248369.1 phosphoglycerate dehydrogenase [Anaerolineales bacterium]MDW8162182.1 phosphoglycerate dehydrogenase [Anaerolineales bacterium]MDW8447043.1 phosphoglycerate dehydrogenase [Anaerolineales bacterium]